METKEVVCEPVAKPETPATKINFVKAIFEITDTKGNSDVRVSANPIKAMTWRVNVFFKDNDHDFVTLWFIAKSFYIRFEEDGKPVIVEQYISPRLNGASS
jgi:hypothetical protein